MEENIKKVLFGGYNKKKTKNVLDNLSNELARVQSELNHQQQKGKEQSEVIERLSKYELEVGIKTNDIKELMQKNEEHKKEISRLNLLLEESLKNAADYNNSINRIGEVYSHAYDSAYKMAEDAQNSAKEFVGVVCENVMEAQNELSQLKFSAIEIKSSIAQRLEQLRRQFLSLQDHILAIADEELELADTINDLTKLKEKTIYKIGDELRNYSINNKAYISSSNISSMPMEFIMKQVKPGPIDNSTINTTISNADDSAFWQEPVSSAEIVPEKEDVAHIESPGINIDKETEPSDVVGKTQLTNEVLEAKEKPLEEQNQVITNKKPTSVKDILKKYENL